MLFKREKDISLYLGSTSGKRNPNLVLNSIAFTQLPLFTQTILIVQGTDLKLQTCRQTTNFNKSLGLLEFILLGLLPVLSAMRERVQTTVSLLRHKRLRGNKKRGFCRLVLTYVGFQHTKARQWAYCI